MNAFPFIRREIGRVLVDLQETREAVKRGELGRMTKAEQARLIASYTKQIQGLEAELALLPTVQPLST